MSFKSVDWTIEIEIEVWCECGRILDTSYERARVGRREHILASPCQDCMEAARQEGREEVRP